jgi:hypothetical protein
MKITDNSASKGIVFALLNPGCVFKFAGGVYMKTCEYINKCTQLPCNAVCLNDGDSASFPGNLTVIVVNCELVIK